RTERNSQAHEGSATPITTLCPRPVAGSYPPPPGRPHPRVGVQPSAWPQPTKQATRPNRLNHVGTLLLQQRGQLVAPARIQPVRQAPIDLRQSTRVRRRDLL